VAVLSTAGVAAADDPGYLSVDSTPVAHVFVDDVDTGSDTPLTHYQLQAGKHQLRLVGSDGTTHTIGIVIVAAKEKHVHVDM
jgi:hypothetical protein